MRLIKFTRLQAAALTLLVASVPAVAFQESKVAPAEQPAVSAPAVPQLQLPAPNRSVQDKPGIQLSSPESAKGTEVRIPGLGKLGVLPKLDFGLDILYGAAEDRRTAPGSSANPEELTVRGTIKHKF